MPILGVCAIFACVLGSSTVRAESHSGYEMRHELTQVGEHTIRLDTFMTFSFDSVASELNVSGPVDVETHFGLRQRGKLADESVAMLAFEDGTTQIATVTINLDGYGFYSGFARVFFVADGVRKEATTVPFFIVHTPERTRLVSFGQFRKLRRAAVVSTAKQSK